MKALDFDKVVRIDKDHVECTIGEKKITRMFRKHTRHIREMMAAGFYCFEIQGILYHYIFDENGVGSEYAEPEDFRSSDRKSSMLVKSKNRNSISITIPEVAQKASQGLSEVSKKQDSQAEVRHHQYDTIKACIENDIPVYLTGPAGSGKNFTLEQISWDLGLDFYFTNSVQQEYKLTGFIDAGGVYHETEFYKAFVNGGIFFLDEMDSSIPEVLVLLNAAIANRYFEFPCGRVQAHKNFRVVAAGNTVGNGADELYTGRMVLDQATLDRFAVIPFDYDETIELHLAEGNKELVDFVHDIRRSAETGGIRCTFSYRCLTMVTKLERTNIPLDQILFISVFKGLDMDTIRGLVGPVSNKYHKALYNVL